MKIELPSITGEVVFSYEHRENTIKRTVEVFLRAHIGNVIRDADLSNLDLSGIDFGGSNFDSCHFTNTNFSICRFGNTSFKYCVFKNSSFDNCVLNTACFSYNSFYNSRFDNSSFEYCNFQSCRFNMINFDKSSFYNSSFCLIGFTNSSFNKSSFDNGTIRNMREAFQLPVFDYIKHDLWAKSLMQKHELQALRNKIINGEIDGNVYEGSCCCFAGTIANAALCTHDELNFRHDPDSPVEEWFSQISPGKTPETSEVVKLTLEWIDELIGYLQA